jgi:hypothetical protein
LLYANRFSTSLKSSHSVWHTSAIFWNTLENVCHIWNRILLPYRILTGHHQGTVCSIVWRKQEAPTLGVASVLARNTEVRLAQKKASVSRESIWCGYKRRMWAGTFSITVASAATDTWQQHEALCKYSPTPLRHFMDISRVKTKLTYAAKTCSKVITKLQ